MDMQRERIFLSTYISLLQQVIHKKKGKEGNYNMFKSAIEMLTMLKINVWH